MLKKNYLRIMCGVCFTLPLMSMADELTVSAITAPAVNKDVPIQLSANDGLTTRIYLNSDFGPVMPTYVDMVNGQWQGKIRFLTAGENNHLQMSWYDDKHKSTQSLVTKGFDVKPALQARIANAMLSGYVSDSQGQAQSGVIIRLINAQQQLVQQSQTDKQGQYYFANIPAGTFYLQINQQAPQAIELAAGRHLLKDFTLPTQKLLATDLAKVPVLIVPGIMGSTLASPGRIYPRLPFITPKWDDNVLSLHDPFGQVGWQHLINLLEANGYQQGKNLFVVAYDWTLDNPQVRDQFLLPWINKAKQVSGSDQVDIIAHSMGGLITRAYIQSPAYAHDVRKFAMIGTPNKGATTPYYLVEGGDPLAADTYGAINHWYTIGKYFYSNTLDYYSLDHFNKHACQFGFLARFTPEKCDVKYVYQMMHTFAPSVGELLNIQGDTIKSMTGIDMALKVDENRFIKALNHQACFNGQTCLDPQGQPYQYVAPEQVMTAGPEGVQTMTFTGINHDTLHSIFTVLPASNEMWFYSDGIPVTDMLPTKTNGDGTVLQDSVLLDPTIPNISRVGVHATLIGTFKEDVVKFITGQNTVNMPVQANTAEPIVLAIDSDGPVDIGLRQDNQPVKLDQQQQLIQHGAVIKNNPSDGHYILSISDKDHADYSVSIRLLNLAKQQVIAETRVRNNEPINLAFNLQNQALQFDRLWSAPSALKLVKQADQVRLSWQDTENDIDHYDIYAKADDQAYYQKVATTKQTTITLSQQNKAYHYTVKAVLKNGEASVFSAEAE